MKKLVLSVAALLLLLSSCTSLKTTMKEPNVNFELYADNVELSQQVSAEATSTRIVGIDWSRLFSTTTGVVEGPVPSLASIPVIGNYVTGTTANFALYELMEANKGYDIIFYPQYSIKVERPIGIGFLYKIETVSVTGRLAKMK